ncbi:uncharacterized protein LOC142324513 [Lycorma delicatula]|uniref:uncharacterized protein LOC142324513 n=1 Tax=Lycorma delicatula TaxID=130591 RepID=UPI003F514BB2
MWKLICCSTLITIVIKTTGGNPLWGNSVPFWKNPCGGIIHVSSVNNVEDLKEVQVRSIRKIRQQLKLSQLQIVHYNIDNLLIDAQRALDRENYIPNWIPDISSVEPIMEEGIQSLSNYPDQLTDMHTDLQKFSIAFEQVWLDETDNVKKQAMANLIEYLRELLCEVENTLVSLGEIIPEVLPRSLMTPSERELHGSYTFRVIRDNGILLKYKEFLNAWISVFRQARFNSEFQERRRKRAVFV